MLRLLPSRRARKKQIKEYITIKFFDDDGQALGMEVSDLLRNAAAVAARTFADELPFRLFKI